MRPLVMALLACALAPSAPARAQTQKAWARISVFGDGASTTQDSGFRSTFSEVMTNITFQSAQSDDLNYEYRADIRMAGYPNSSDRSRRVSIYDAYAGFRLSGGTVGVRVGQMWLNELGGLGQLGGAMVEVRQPKRQNRGRWRAALFGGLEPQILDAGYVSSVYKVGAMAAYDGAGAWRNVFGFVTIRDRGLTERAVLTTNNFMPVGKKFFLYQAAEYDVRGPAVSGIGSLTYFFASGRYAPNDRVEFQGMFHRGRSIDSRSIIQDQLDGRPIDPRTLDGLRYESVSGRVTVKLARNLRVFGGYGQDRNNMDSAVAGRITYGLFAGNIARTGLDVTASDSRIDRGTSGSYDSWYVSVGRSVSSHIYLTGDYSSSLSIFRFTSPDGFVIESRPTTKRVSVSGVFNLNRGTSLLMEGERVLDSGSSQTRLMSGITYRF